MSVEGTGAFRNKLLILFGFLAAVYILCFDLRELWTDEGVRLMIMNGGRQWAAQVAANDIAPPGNVLEALGPMQHQPAFYLMGNFLFHLTGRSSVVLIKLINLFLLFGSLYPLLQLFRRWKEPSRLLLVFLFAMNGYLLMHAGQFREYPLYLASVVWSIYFYFELYYGSDLSGRRYAGTWIGYVLTGIVGYYSTSFFVLFLGAQALFAPWQNENRMRFLKAVYSGLVAIGLGALPWVLWVSEKYPTRSDPGRYSASEPQTLEHLFNTMRIGFRLLLSFQADDNPATAPSTFAGSFLHLYFLLAIIGLAAIILIVLRRPREADPRVLFALLTVCVFFAFQTYWFFFRDQLSVWPRYFLGHYFGVVVLLGYGFERIYLASESSGRTYFRTISIVLTALVVASGLLQANGYLRWPYMDSGLTRQCGWQEVSVKLASMVRPGDTVIYYRPLLAWTLGVRTPAAESDFEGVISGNYKKNTVVWVLDSHVEKSNLDRAALALEQAGYRFTSSEALGCLADLRRYELGGTAAASANGPLPGPGQQAVVLEAESFSAGTVVPDSKEWGTGIGVLTSPKFPAWAEYKVRLPRGGSYELMIRYASAEVRPVTVRIDGKSAITSGAAAITGGFTPEHQQWRSAGVVQIRNQDVTLRLDSPIPFPHIDKIALVPR